MDNSSDSFAASLFKEMLGFSPEFEKNKIPEILETLAGVIDYFHAKKGIHSKKALCEVYKEITLLLDRIQYSQNTVQQTSKKVQTICTNPETWIQSQVIHLQDIAYTTQNKGKYSLLDLYRILEEVHICMQEIWQRHMKELWQNSQQKGLIESEEFIQYTITLHIVLEEIIGKLSPTSDPHP